MAIINAADLKVRIVFFAVQYRMKTGWRDLTTDTIWPTIHNAQQRITKDLEEYPDIVSWRIWSLRDKNHPRDVIDSGLR